MEFIYCCFSVKPTPTPKMATTAEMQICEECGDVTNDGEVDDVDGLFYCKSCWGEYFPDEVYGAEDPNVQSQSRPVFTQEQKQDRAWRTGRREILLDELKRAREELSHKFKVLADMKHLELSYMTASETAHVGAFEEDDQDDDDIDGRDAISLEH